MIAETNGLMSMRKETGMTSSCETRRENENAQNASAGVGAGSTLQAIQGPER